MFSLSGDHRTRYERLSNQFRAGLDGVARALMLRTRVSAELDAGPFRLRAEVQDSRAHLADSVAALTTSMVNPVEPLQAYVEIPLDDLRERESRSVLRAGRFTMDIGSRRLVSHNRFRNTSDGFTGIEWQWRSSSDSRVRAFYTLPVERRVSGNILDNSPRFDKEWRGVRFRGVHISRPDLPWGDRGEAYLPPRRAVRAQAPIADTRPVLRSPRPSTSIEPTVTVARLDRPDTASAGVRMPLRRRTTGTAMATWSTRMRSRANRTSAARVRARDECDVEGHVAYSPLACPGASSRLSMARRGHPTVP